MSLPPGLKVYRALLSPDEIEQIRRAPELPQSSQECPQLFRLFGDFGGKEANEPAPWMQEWGKKMQERGLFRSCPNQYRLCDWIGDLSAQFKWHIDNDRHGPRILVISLTEGRRIGFRHQKMKGHEELALEAGDAYLMKGAARSQWEHCVLPNGHERSGGQSFIMSLK